MAAAKKPTPKDTSAKPGVFDVSKPGAPNLPVSSTSRPIIIKNRTVTDPMVVAAGDKPEDPQAAPVVQSPAKKKVVVPLHDSLGAATIDAWPTVKTAVPEAKPVTDEPSETPAEEAPAPELPATETDTKAGAQPEAPINDNADKSEATEEPVAKTAPVTDITPVTDQQPATATKPAAPQPEVKPETTEAAVPADHDTREAESEVARERAARLEKLVESEEYFLPIETVEQRRSRRVAIFGLLLIIILAAAWYNVALDAGLLPNTYNLPHTTFFSIK